MFSYIEKPLAVEKGANKARSNIAYHIKHLDPRLIEEMSFVEECKTLVKDIVPRQFAPPLNDVFIPTRSWERMVVYVDGSVGLFAQATGNKLVPLNMENPGIREFLMELADLGVGVQREYLGVDWEFRKM